MSIIYNKNYNEGKPTHPCCLLGFKLKLLENITVIGSDQGNIFSNVHQARSIIRNDKNSEKFRDIHRIFLWKGWEQG